MNKADQVVADLRRLAAMRSYRHSAAMMCAAADVIEDLQFTINDLTGELAQLKLEADE